MLTPDEVAARTARAVAAAAAAGRGLGLRVDEPRVLYDFFSVIVHLAPEPVVVRVPTVLTPSYVADPDSQTAQQQLELDVTGWLADRAHPVVPPSALVPREPVRRDGFSMTFWEFVEESTATQDAARRFTMTARLHSVLSEYDGSQLGFWTPFATYIPDGLTALEHQNDLLGAADLVRAQREWAAIGPMLTSQAAFKSAFPEFEVQPIHGDAPYHNMISTSEGELWSDFELVTLGPVESDLALVGPEGVQAYHAAAAPLGLRPLDPRVLRLTEAAGLLSGVACLALTPQLPMLFDGLEPMIDLWRNTPPFAER